nr:hypothetical protein [uncultured Trichococcus sp.]
MIVIAIDSVFQMVNALNIARDEFPNDKITILIKSKQRKTFENNKWKMSPHVHDIYYSNKKYEVHKHEIVWQLSAVLFPKMATRQLFNDELVDLDVSAIIASTTWIDLLSPVYRSYKTPPKLYLVEEGLGTYVKQDRIFGNQSITHLLKFKLLRREELVNKAIFRFLLPDYISKLYLNFHKAPNITADLESTDRLINFFGSKEDLESINKTKLIYLEQVFCTEHNSDEIKAAFNERELMIREMLLKDRNAIVKSHPRYFNTISKKYPVLESRIPWEAISPSINVKEKILVSIHSTSIVTPKIMQNEEPVVICLIEIFRDLLEQLVPNNGREEIDNIVDFFNYIKKMYDEPSRFMIPKSIEDLKELIKDLEY